jgi:hypothetical protein
MAKNGKNCAFCPLRPDFLCFFGAVSRPLAFLFSDIAAGWQSPDFRSGTSNGRNGASNF